MWGGGMASCKAVLHCVVRHTTAACYVLTRHAAKSVAQLHALTPTCNNSMLQTGPLTSPWKSSSVPCNPGRMSDTGMIHTASTTFWARRAASNSFKHVSSSLVDGVMTLVVGDDHRIQVVDGRSSRGQKPAREDNKLVSFALAG
eukprot:359469-Chlamydomonas_euryale.AAC.10